MFLINYFFTFKMFMIILSAPGTVLGVIKKIWLCNQNVGESLQYVLKKPFQVPINICSAKKLMSPSHPLNLICNSLMPLIKLRVVY